MNRGPKDIRKKTERPAAEPRCWTALLETWIFEWTLDRTFAAGEERGFISTPDPAPFPPPVELGYDRGVRAGDIWLLHPAGVPVVRPVYLAVLERRPDQRLCVAPFSRFSVPAFEGEWNTGRDAPALRVLGHGFARAVPLRCLAGAWRAGRLSVSALKTVLELRAGTAPIRARRACGPPLVHPEDPRRTYVDEENLWLDEWAAQWSHPASTPQAPCVRENDESLPLAAETKNRQSRYDPRRK